MTKQINYKLRAESTHDSLFIRQILQPWMVNWQEAGVMRTSHGTDHSTITPDVDVTFTLRRMAPSLPELRWLFSRVTGLNVAAETVELARYYNGTRNNDYKVLQTPRVVTMSSFLKNLKPSSLDWDKYWDICYRLD